jgi:hypothetical protein
MATAAESLARARALLRAGKAKRAIGPGWDAAREAFRVGDAAVLEETAALAGDLAAALDGRARGQAELLAAYCERCAADARAGLRTLTPLERLMGIGGLSRSKKTCPECAEQVQKAARVCRFCGHRFEPPA